MRNLQTFQNTGAPLAADLDEEMAEIVGTYNDPSLIERANLEHELYLIVSTIICVGTDLGHGIRRF